MTEIYYYTGTGFTLSAAKLLKTLINDDVKLKPIIVSMKHEMIESNAKTIGFLFPMHSYDLPNVYKEFIKKFHCPKAKYIFSLVTCGGAPVNVFKKINKYLKKQNKILDAYNFIVTPNTFDPIFKVRMNSFVKKERMKFEENIVNFSKIINQKKQSRKLTYRNYFLEYTMFPIIRFLNHKTRYYKLEKSFYSDENCISCGKCALLCPAEKIRIQDNRPIWNENIECQFCLGCLHRCPTESIQIKNTKTNILGRIYPQDIKLEELINQKPSTENIVIE